MPKNKSKWGMVSHTHCKEGKIPDAKWFIESRAEIMEFLLNHAPGTSMTCLTGIGYIRGDSLIDSDTGKPYIEFFEATGYSVYRYEKKGVKRANSKGNAKKTKK